MMLEPCWNHAGTMLERCWHAAGPMLERCCNDAATMLEPSWNDAAMMWERHLKRWMTVVAWFSLPRMGSLPCLFP